MEGKLKTYTRLLTKFKTTMEGKPKTYARLLTNSQQNNDGGKTQDIHQTADQI
jgi:hypothetical protein